MYVCTINAIVPHIKQTNKNNDYKYINTRQNMENT